MRVLYFPRLFSALVILLIAAYGVRRHDGLDVRWGIRGNGRAIPQLQQPILPSRGLLWGP
jgi:hypothetical protein